FFSSRRRHTRSKRDWSSDVCSSDLTVTELDGFVFYHNDGTTERLESRGLTITGLTTSGAWEHASMTLSPNAEMSGRLAIGTRQSYGTSPNGTIRSEERRVGKECRSRWGPDH